jgi:hypothetical protein
MAVELSVTLHAGGFGRCHLCGEESLHRAMLSAAGRRKTILLCDGCNQKVVDDPPTRSHVMSILNRE